MSFVLLLLVIIECFMQGSAHVCPLCTLNNILMAKKKILFAILKYAEAPVRMLHMNYICRTIHNKMFACEHNTQTKNLCFSTCDPYMQMLLIPLPWGN